MQSGAKIATVPVHEALESVAWVPPAMGLPVGVVGKKEGVGKNEGGKKHKGLTAGHVVAAGVVVWWCGVYVCCDKHIYEMIYTS